MFEQSTRYHILVKSTYMDLTIAMSFILLLVVGLYSLRYGLSPAYRIQLVLFLQNNKQKVDFILSASGMSRKKRKKIEKEKN